MHPTAQWLSQMKGSATVRRLGALAMKTPSLVIADVGYRGCTESWLCSTLVSSLTVSDMDTPSEDFDEFHNSSGYKTTVEFINTYHWLRTYR